MTLPRTPVQFGFSQLAEALSDPAREAIVSALADGRALPAGELALVAGVSPQSASAHLQKLVDARVLTVLAQGRFRYYRIADDDVAALLENLVNLAAKTQRLGRRPPPVADELRQSRTCYCHLAGQLGVLLGNALQRHRFIAVSGQTGEITETGVKWCRSEAIDFSPSRAPHCRLCNDWTERVPHLSGPLPNAILKRLTETHCVTPGRSRGHCGSRPRGVRSSTGSASGFRSEDAMAVCHRTTI